MTLDHASRLASEIVRVLRPYCDKIEIGGSIRRQKPVVGDIEIVCIPKLLPQKDLFDKTYKPQRHPGFAQAVYRWKKVKGDPSTGKYTQRVMTLEDYPSIKEKEINIDIFIVTEENWGNQLLIRTGNSDYSAKIMTHLNTIPGYEHRDGYLYINDVMKPVYTEEEFYQLLQLEYVHPHLRK